ncbi:TldD/PmbA family protein [Sporosalibacterium faouarense]|uniref:TldD/PmbA family protein n=1 Tax=Sporosalibacterium faouarense TaxID=516123 RepID=UPI00192B7E36|nr:TldD/PmbA family protein [Sporosalibacterium faouarense]
MTKKEFIDLLFEKGRLAGIEDMEVFVQRNSELELMVFKGEIDKFSKAEEEGLSFRGIYRGKMGYSYTEKIDETSLNILIEELISNAKVIDSEDIEEMFEGSESYREVNVYDESFQNISTEEKISFIKALEKEAFNSDPRVTAVDYCLFGENTINSIMKNTKGLDIEDKANVAYGYISAIVKEGEDVKNGARYVVSNNFADFNPKKLANEAVKEAVSMLGAKSVKSDNYPIILRNNAAASLLEAFAPIFSAEQVQKNLSLLKDKLNETIANDNITLIDDPFMKKGVASKSFDGEGVATKYKRIIENGVLNTYLHNMKTAKKDGVESTGNAYKASYKSSIEIAPTNMYIEEGDTSLEELISTTNNGILIIELQGLHSGLDIISGDFSLSAYGYLIKNGEINRPVNQITVAGNYYDMLKNIEEVGSDIKFNLPGYGYIGSPSLKIKELSVSGE